MIEIEMMTEQQWQEYRTREDEQAQFDRLALKTNPKLITNPNANQHIVARVSNGSASFKVICYGLQSFDSEIIKNRLRQRGVVTDGWLLAST
jgi:hypothetical protein